MSGTTFERDGFKSMMSDIEAVISELNKLLETVHTNEDEFIRAAIENLVQSQKSELKKARKLVKQYEKRVSALDKLFTRLTAGNMTKRERLRSNTQPF